MQRRDFLKTAASTAALGVLAACTGEISLTPPAKTQDSSQSDPAIPDKPNHGEHLPITPQANPESAVDINELARMGKAAQSEPLGAPLIASSAVKLDDHQECRKLFNHGVASGDPLPDRVIIWTRLSIPAYRQEEATNAFDRHYYFSLFAEGKAYREHFTKLIGEDQHRAISADSQHFVEVIWEVARDANMQDIVAHGYCKAKKSRDYTVKVDAPLPHANQTYYYRFRALGYSSPIGRTRSAPAFNTDIDSAKIALFSCSDLQSGYFNAYRNVAKMHDIALCLHVGDYIYEMGYPFGPINRLHAHNAVIKPQKLSEFRGRFCQYRLDLDLQECHRQHPFAVIWDDHEFVDNFNGSNPEWQQIKANAPLAYEEWMPLRRIVNPDDSDEFLLYRQLAYGKLVNINLIDARRYRSPTDGAKAASPERTMLGNKQLRWLLDGLQAAQQRGCRWKVLANQLIFSECKGGSKDNMHGYGDDLWNGYAYERDRILKYIGSHQIDNFVVLSGDWHTGMAFDLVLNPYQNSAYNPATGQGALGVELVAPAVTSDVYSDNGTSTANNPHLCYHNGKDNGYVLLEFTQNECRADFRMLKSLNKHDERESVTSLQTQNLANHLIKISNKINTEIIGGNEQAFAPQSHAQAVFVG